MTCKSLAQYSLTLANRKFYRMASNHSNRGRKSSHHKGGGSSNSNRSSDDRLIHLSKALSWLLRHGAVKEGLNFLPGGYLFVDDVLVHPTFVQRGYTVEDIHRCVETNEKKRFGLDIDQESGKEIIRAHQGHSLDDANVDMREIIDPNEFPIVVHGTYKRHWPSIQEKGLSRMGRVHIHFAPGMPDASGVISGMRSSADLYIIIDMERAITDGYKFFVSENNVILSPGNQDGCLPVSYFRSVKNRRGETIPLPIESFKKTASNDS